MEPHPFGRGNLAVNECGDVGVVLASMEPHPFGRGNCDRIYRPRPRLRASMEPHPFGRGNPEK